MEASWRSLFLPGLVGGPEEGGLLRGDLLEEGLCLGGLAVGMAFMIGNPLIIIVVGIVYICEAASVILQVGYFKLTHGKRLFKMAPIHHHFEKCGWSEIKIVGIFSLITLIAGAISLLGL